MQTPFFCFLFSKVTLWAKRGLCVIQLFALGVAVHVILEMTSCVLYSCASRIQQKQLQEHIKLKKSVSGLKCQFSPEGLHISLIQPSLALFEHKAYSSTWWDSFHPVRPNQP